MKKRIIILSVLLLVAAVIATFFLLPLKAWKAGETYNIGKDKIAYNPQTCTYVPERDYYRRQLHGQWR